MTRLSKEEWRELDTLLSKVGFGGYYDVVECLRTIIINLSPKFTNKIKTETDIQTLIMIIMTLSKGSEIP
jgi:hypothetical protein